MLATYWNIYIVMVAFTAMGVGALAFPEKVTSQFGITALTSAGRNEVRAVYGGFGLMMGFMLYVAVANAELRQGICLTLSAALGGMAVGRVISFALDRKSDLIPLTYLLLEALLAALLLVNL